MDPIQSGAFFAQPMAALLGKKSYTKTKILAPLTSQWIPLIRRLFLPRYGRYGVPRGAHIRQSVGRAAGCTNPPMAASLGSKSPAMVCRRGRGGELGLQSRGPTAAVCTH